MKNWNLKKFKFNNKILFFYKNYRNINCKRLFFIYISIFIFYSGIINAEFNNKSISITTDNGWFIVNGEKFFIKGVCFFENHTVEGKFTRSSLKILDHEFRRIKEAGFNAIRSQLKPEELKLAKKHGLMVMQGANHLFFSKEYKDPLFIQNQINTTRHIMEYSKKHDNILYYIIDNEPVIEDKGKGIYPQGEEAILKFYKKLINISKGIQTQALLSMATYPQAGFLDYSIFDCISLNLYPFAIQHNSIGYSGYARWFKKTYSHNKPFIISEYGWQIFRGLQNFNQVMINLLDEQIKSGATGSFFYTWRAFGEEKDPYEWFGLIPNNGKKDAYKNQPRTLYYDFQKYFEAVVIEPKKQTAYIKKIPVKIYGTDKTGSIEAFFNNKKYNLNKTGNYWWETDIPFNISSIQEGKITISARDKKGKILVKKEINIFLSPYKKYLKVKIICSNKVLKQGDTYSAKIYLTDQNDKGVSDKKLLFGIHQSGKDLWLSEKENGVTDKNGIYYFSWKNLYPGYFTLMATVASKNKHIKIYPDVTAIRIER